MSERRQRRTEYTPENPNLRHLHAYLKALTAEHIAGQDAVGPPILVRQVHVDPATRDTYTDNVWYRFQCATGRVVTLDVRYHAPDDETVVYWTSPHVILFGGRSADGNLVPIPVVIAQGHATFQHNEPSRLPSLEAGGVLYPGESGLRINVHHYSILPEELARDPYGSEVYRLATEALGEYEARPYMLMSYEAAAQFIQTSAVTSFPEQIGRLLDDLSYLTGIRRSQDWVPNTQLGTEL